MVLRCLPWIKVTRCEPGRTRTEWSGVVPLGWPSIRTREGGVEVIVRLARSDRARGRAAEALALRRAARAAVAGFSARARAGVVGWFEGSSGAALAGGIYLVGAVLALAGAASSAARIGSSAAGASKASCWAGASRCAGWRKR